MTTCNIRNQFKEYQKFKAPDGIIPGDHAILQVADSDDGLYLSHVNRCVTYDLMNDQ